MLRSIPTSDPPFTAHQHLEERFIEYRGGRLRYLIGGQGQPLLLAHGFTGSAENFDTWFDDLIPLRRLVIPDLPGFGLSTPLRTPHVAETMADAMIAILDAEKIERFDLGGLCIGASIALDVLRRHQERVAKLVLHTPLLEPELVLPRFHRQARFMTSPGIFPLVVWLSRQRRVSNWYKRNFTEDKGVDDRGAAVNFYNQQRASPRAAKEWLHDGLRRHDLSLVEGFRGETLVIIAADDKIVDVDELRERLNPFEHVHLALFENAGHGWSEDFVRRQNALLVAFLTGSTLPSVNSAEAAV